MATLLHIDSSPMGAHSVSRELTRHFVEHWLGGHSGGRVIVRDLNKMAVPPVDAAFVAAMYTPEERQTPEQKTLLAQSNALVDDLFTADEYVLGTPMHNFGVSAAMKLWIDQICRAGRTFAYIDGKPTGLVTGKKATIMLAAGGTYDAGSATESLNNAEPYLRSVLGFLGVKDVTFVTAGGAASLRGGVDRGTFMAPFLTKIKEQLGVSA